MHVYFVRHGQTDENQRSVYQAPNTSLSAKGYDEARTVGELLRPTNPTLVVSSTHERAIQTARIIGQCVGITPTINHLVREVEWPSDLIGQRLNGVRALTFLFLSTLYRNSPTWHYKDAENYRDIYLRIQKTYRFIESLAEAHDAIVIVSHSEYLRLLVRYMCHGERLSLGELLGTLFSVNHMKNGEVLHVEYVGPTPNGTCPWILH
jgi:glucosyl-3-phosphoglycerate phosphatase